MKSVDTNLLVRLIVRDDQRQVAASEEWIISEAAANGPILINSIVLCEIAWVLGSAYGYSRQEVAEELADLIGSGSFLVEDESEAGAGLNALLKNCDFSDGVIAHRNLRLGSDATGTLDRTAATRLPGFEFVRLGG